MSLAILNGEYVDREQASVGVDDRGFILGDGLFETMRAHSGVVFRLQDHLERLAEGCRAFGLSSPWRAEDLAQMAAELVKRNKVPSARVRLTLSRGTHGGSMGLKQKGDPTLLITAEALPPNLDERVARGITLAVAEVRFSENNPVFRHKTLNRLPHLLARSQAERAGADEALVLDERGNVACASTGNVFAVQYGQLFTPPLSGPVLPGVTRKVIMEIAEELGIKTRQDFFSPIMLLGADEAFISNSVQTIVPVLKLGEQQVGSGRPGPVAGRLARRLRELAGPAEAGNTVVADFEPAR